MTENFFTRPVHHDPPKEVVPPPQLEYPHEVTCPLRADVGDLVWIIDKTYIPVPDGVCPVCEGRGGGVMQGSDGIERAWECRARSSADSVPSTRWVCKGGVKRHEVGTLTSVVKEAWVSAITIRRVKIQGKVHSTTSYSLDLWRCRDASGHETYLGSEQVTELYLTQEEAEAHLPQPPRKRPERTRQKKAEP